jgi:C-terminal peptidase prc
MKVLALLTLLAAPQEPATHLDEMLAEATAATPAAILVLADQGAVELSAPILDGLGARLATAEGKQLLLLGRLQAWADQPTGVERLVELLDPADLDLSFAALQTLRLPAFHSVESANSALGIWLADQVAEDAPRLWVEGQYTLFHSSTGAHRRAALRNMRSVMMSENLDLRTAAVLALGRSGSPLGADEIDALQKISEGISSDSVLAESLLQQVEQQERFRSKIAALQSLQSSTPQSSNSKSVNKEPLAVLDELLLRIRTQHMEGDKYSDEELIAAAADGMLRRLDPHSTYFSSEEYGQFMFDMTQAYGGIGAYVNTVDNVFTILRPIYSGPAYGAGLLSGDKILAVDGWSTVDQPNDEIIKRLKGEPGTEVKLEVYRTGWTKPKDIAVERARIKLPTVQTEMLPGGILYMELIEFSEDVAMMIVRAINAAQDQGELNGVVLDLRNNPGGYLMEAVQICDVFLPKGKVVVTTKSRSGSDEVYKTRVGELVSPDVPLTILINEYSASASEIVSGALSSHGRAVTVGARTYGKGSVQNVFPMRAETDEPFQDSDSTAGPRNGLHDEWEAFEDVNGNGKYDYGARVKLTIAYYYLPDGSTIHTQRDRDGRITDPGGVHPDREVEFPQMDFVVARELNRLLAEDPFRPYAERIFAEDHVLATELAINDLRDIKRYPGWDAFYTSLDTELDPQEARRWVRRMLRGVVSDDRGKVFPGNGFLGDYVEDPQLQEAIRAVLERSKLTYEDVPEYAELIAQG